MSPSHSTHSNQDPLDVLLERLHGLRRVGSGWMARCPAHKVVRESGVVLLRDADSRAYARYEHAGHFELWSVGSKTFKHYLRWVAHSQLGRTPNAQAVADAINTLEAMALFEGEEAAVYLRVAGLPNEIDVDLVDAAWRVVRITAKGWEILDEAPVYFRRTAGMAALPAPVPGGDLAQLRDLVNLASEDDYRLLVAWLIAALRPPGQPYPLLVLHGEQGSAKSTTAKVIRALIDPSTVALRSAPRDVRDLMISASASWVLSFDNLSGVPAWLSDALCRVAPGGGFTTRELYSDQDEVIFDVQRPVILNGIEEIVTRSNLLDRALLIQLPPIPSERRRHEQELWQAFQRARPALLGALLDALVGALRHIDSVQLERPPRMADLALWVTAAESALGWPHDAFVAAYDQNRGQAHELAIEASPIGNRLVAIARGSFHGTAGELLVRQNTEVDEQVGA